MGFTRAIVREPGRSFADGLTSGAGSPDLDAALRQHRLYCKALRDCGLTLTYLDPDPAHPDGTFVEDTAIVTERGAVVTRPGAPSRRGETSSVEAALRVLGFASRRIEAPGTVDGGDVCEADGHFHIGLSARTNAAGARQLSEHLIVLGYSASTVDISASKTLLHLKTGLAYLGDGIWVMPQGIERELPSVAALPVRVLITVPAAEARAANCVRVNECVLVPAGCPETLGAMERRGLKVLALDMSEFQKMDGGLSCLSLRF